jgi:hypothetical protein
MKDKALKKAQHALEGVLQVPEKISMMYILDVVRFIREAREEKQQEPVLMFYEQEWQGYTSREYQWLIDPFSLPAGTKLYTSPSARKPLTDEQVWLDDDLMKLNAVLMLPMDYFMRVVKTVEAAHGIKE